MCLGEWFICFACLIECLNVPRWMLYMLCMSLWMLKCATVNALYVLCMSYWIHKCASVNAIGLYTTHARVYIRARMNTSMLLLLNDYCAVLLVSIYFSIQDGQIVVTMHGICFHSQMFHQSRTGWKLEFAHSHGAKNNELVCCHWSQQLRKVFMYL